MLQWIFKKSVIRALLNPFRRFLYLENYSENTETEKLKDAADNILTSMLYLPFDCTHLIQSYEGFVTQKIKRRWTTWQKTYEIKTIEENI